MFINWRKIRMTKFKSQEITHQIYSTAPLKEDA